MACSACGADGHNIQTCDRVRRCRHCNGRGHDRRNCPVLAGDGHQTGPQASDHSVAGPASYEHIVNLCSDDADLLAHLYWRRNSQFFESALSEYQRGGRWRFVPTPGHGVQRDVFPQRYSVNFFVADTEFARSHQDAARARGLEHGVLLKRSAVRSAATTHGFDYEVVRVGHPKAHRETDPTRFWMFDLGNHRVRAVASLQFAKVVRIAAPPHSPETAALVDHDAVVAWW